MALLTGIVVSYFMASADATSSVFKMAFEHAKTTKIANQVCCLIVFNCTRQAIARFMFSAKLHVNLKLFVGKNCLKFVLTIKKTFEPAPTNAIKIAFP